MKRLLTVVIAGTILFSSCGDDPKSEKTMSIIGKKEIKVDDNLMTPEMLWHFGRVGNVTVSPDKKQVAYTITWYDIEENRGNSDIHIMDINGENKKQLTHSAEGEYGLQWHPNGEHIGFIKGGSIFEINPNGTGIRKIYSDKKLPVSSFSYSPTGDKVVLAIETPIEKVTGKDIYPDLPKANVHTASDLMYRHWDTWKEGNYSHLYVANYAGSGITHLKDIMPGEPFDAPMKPFDDISEVSWSPDGKTLAYSCKKLQGIEYAESTNSNIYLYNLDSEKTDMLTEGMYGYDKTPNFSPDGSKLLWLSMERPGYEADKERIFVYDFATKEKRNYSENFDASPSSVEWTADGNLNLTACFMQTFRIFNLNTTSGEFTQVTKDADCDYQGVQSVDNGYIAVVSQIVKPNEIHFIDATTKESTEISFVNKDFLDQLDMPKVEKRMVKTTDDKEMLTWVVTPPNFDASKKYPVVMMCTGGPQGPISQSFSYRWNFALMASKGYVVIYPSRRGVGGLGQEWSDAVSRDHGGQPERDLLSAIDDVSKEPWADENRLAAVGASYGGYSIFWLAGNHNKRFKAFISHCGIFDMQGMYGTTEELFFENWETGGAPWDKDNAVAQKSFKQSPMNFVKNWDTPILIIHGEQDYRVPYTQSLAAFTAARSMNVPSRLLVFPTETHWVTSPQNAMVWQREFFSWLDTHVK